MRSFQFVILFFCFFIFQSSFAQIRSGVRVAPGLGYLKSKNLKRYFNNLEEESPQNDNFNTSARLRSHFGIGGFVEYKLSENIFLAAEPALTFSSNKILINYKEDNVNAEQNGTVTRYSSDARIKATYISLPLVAKFRFNHRRELFVFGGLALNFHFTPTLVSEEEIVQVNYIEGISTQYPKQEIDTRMKLKGYSFLNVNPVIGFGKVFNPYGRNIILDIRYTHPVTKSSLYSEGVIVENMVSNYVFTEEGKNFVNTAYPQYPFNDFKMGLLSISISYTLYKNYR